METLNWSKGRINGEYEIRLLDFENISLSSSVSLQDPPSDIDFEWDEKVNQEYKKNLKKLLGWENMADFKLEEIK